MSAQPVAAPAAALLSETAFVATYAPRRPDGALAGSVREAISGVNDLPRLRDAVAGDLTLWSLIDTSCAFVAVPGLRNAAVGYFLARVPVAEQPVKAVLDDSAFCVLWHPIDSPQRAYVTSAVNAADARQRFIQDVPAHTHDDARLNVDYFIENVFAFSLSDDAPFGFRPV